MDLNEYVNQLKDREFSSAASPKKLRLNGKTGKYEMSRKDGNEWVNDEHKTPWQGVVLAHRYLCQWKFDPTSSVRVFTKEFSDFDNPITLLKVEGDMKKELHYPDYATFKDTFVKADPATGKSKSPFDFMLSLYVLDLSLDEVVQFRFKGQSRSNWFDFILPQEYGHRLKCIMDFGVDEYDSPMKNKDGEIEKYYAATFKPCGPVEGELAEKVMRSHKGLVEWLQGWERKNMELSAPEAKKIEAPAEVVHYEKEVEPPSPKPYEQSGQINIEDIPF